MNHRSEPRFKTEAQASLQVLRDRAQEFEAMITDASSVGLGIQMTEPLRPREVVRICTESDYVFAIVQHCTAIENNLYSVGVVRIDEWHPVGDRKPDLESLRKDAPATVDAVEKPRLDLGDLQTHAIKELFQQSPDKAERRAQKEKKQDKNALEAAAARLQDAAGPSKSADQPAATAEATAKATTEATAETAEPSEAAQPQKKAKQPPKKSVGRAKVLGASVGLLILVLLLGGVGSGFHFGLGQPAVAELTPQPAPNKEVAENTDPQETAATASEETLSADQTEAPAELAADASSEETAAPVTELVATRNTTAPVQNTPVASPQTAPPVTAKPAPSKSAAAAPAASGKEHTVVIRSSGPSWTTVCIDHAKAFEGLVDAGDSREFSYHDQMLLRSGNIGALSVSRDSQPVATSNAVGTIAAWEFTPAGAQQTSVEATQKCN